ncbi:MAG: D-alanine--D-alanine ligase [Flavobacteriia bacterium]|nr:MAG: D-alanine--D-alanine ligase [Flavobacteriia bacterium]
MKKSIAIIMGGYSSEYEISIQSGNVVYQNLDTEKYDLYRILILKEKWVYVDENEVEHPVNVGDFTTTVNGYKIKFDCIFNAIHGHPGEDGTILAYFDLLGLKHTSAPFYQMAVTFNKRDTLSFLKPFGINVARSHYLNKGDKINPEAIIAEVGLPCFVKPNHGGSSFGVSKVKSVERLIPAIEIAMKEDDEILIEQFLEGIEISVGVIEYQNKVKVLPITEIVSENEFFDYDAKYLGKSQEITPARISKEQESNVNTAAEKIYRVLNLSGLSRADFIIVGDKPFFIELNMVPGITSESILPKQARAAGISLKELFGNAVEMALK